MADRHTPEYLDGILDDARVHGGTEVEVDGPRVADALVAALLDRAESLTGDVQPLAFSGLRRPGRYTLTVMWCGRPVQMSGSP